MRAFVAIPLPHAATAALAQLQTQARTLLETTRLRCRWTPTDQLHITLRFFAELDAAGLERVTQVLTLLTAQTTSWPMTLEGAGVFPESGPPRVLWIGCGQGREAITRFAEQLNAALTHAGYSAEPRVFHPHVTLARCQTSVARDAVRSALAQLAIPPIPCVVDRFIVMESRLTAQGAVHTLRHTSPLRTPS